MMGAAACDGQVAILPTAPITIAAPFQEAAKAFTVVEPFLDTPMSTGISVLGAGHTLFR
jgi:hypothetical protein